MGTGAVAFNSNLEKKLARIWVLRLGFRPQDWNLGFETGIWASRLGFEGVGMEEKEEEEEKIPICVKA